MKQSIKTILFQSLHSQPGMLLISVFIGIFIYILTQLPYLNLLVTLDIGLGAYWFMLYLIYRFSVRITLYLAISMWILSYFMLLFGGEPVAEILASNVYVLALVAFFQQIWPIISSRKKI